MLKIKNIMCLAGLVALVAGLSWLAVDHDNPNGTTTTASHGLVRSPEVIAEILSRKQGNTELRAERRATIEGRDAYWKLRLGEVPPGYLTQLREQADRIPAASADKDAGLNDWTWLGPGNIGGRVRSLLIDPVNPQNMWLGSVSGGIWRSTNGGNWWTPVDDFMANLAVSCMVMTPDRQYMFAGTGEGFPGALLYSGEGIFRSGDQGNTWQQMPGTDIFNFSYVTRMAAHPDIDGRLYAMTNIRVPGPNNGILYRTDDDGMNWTQALTIGTDGFDVKITNQTADGTPWIMAAGNSELFLSKDDGVSFTSVVNGAVTTPLPTGAGRIEVAFGTSAGNDPVLYASLFRNNGELWRSTDGGDTWVLRSTGTDIFLSTTNQGNYDNALWIEPGNTNRVIWGGVDLYTSTNGGNSFTKASNWRKYDDGTSAHADQHIIVPHPNYSGGSPVIFFGNDGGVQSNVDIWTSGQTAGWSNLANGLGITQFYKGAAAPDRSVVMGGAQDNSFLRFNNGTTESWFQQTTGDGGYVAVNPSDPSTIYASLQNLSLRRSRNGGNSYTDIGKNIPDADANNGSVLFIAPFILDNFTPTTLFAGGLSIWWTTDEGNNWIPSRGAIPSGERCSTIAQSMSDPTRFYAGYENGTVSRTVWNHLSWFDIQDSGAGMPQSLVTDIAIHPTDPDDVIVAYSQVGTQSLWRSFNGGTDWQVISEGGQIDLPASAVNTVTFHPTNPAWIYVGTDAGVFATEDGGQNWSRTAGNYPGSEGPANVKIMDLFWANDFLYAATWGRGMFRSRPYVTVYVDVANTGGPGQEGTELDPYQALSQAESVAGPGTTIIIEGGTYDEVNGLDLNTRGLIRGRNGSVLIK